MFFCSTPEAATWWAKIYTIPVIYIPIGFLNFVGRLTQNPPKKILRVLMVMSIAFIYMDLTGSLVAPAIPKYGFRYMIQAGPAYILLIPFFLVIVLMSLMIQFKALKVAESHQQNVLRLILLSTAVGFGGGSANLYVPYRSWHYPVNPYANLTIVLFVVMVCYAILKHRLMDITIIIRKTMVYAGVMAILTTTYLGVVALFAKVFEGISGSQTVFPSVLAAALITVFFQPLRKRIQAFVDRKFFRSYVDREEKLYELSREVITHATPEAMSQALMRVLQESLHPKVGVLYLKSREGSGFVPTGAWGSQAGSLMPDDNPLARYFVAHPQPFVQDLSDELGESRSTRLENKREDAA